MLGGDWPEPESALSRSLPGAEHHEWRDAGRRITVTGHSDSAALEAVASSLRVRIRRALFVNGQPALPGDVRRTPTGVSRGLLAGSTPVRERIMAAL